MDEDDRCESCGWSQVATTFVDFQDHGPVFYVCDQCADDVVHLGIGMVVMR